MPDERRKGATGGDGSKSRQAGEERVSDTPDLFLARVLALGHYLLSERMGRYQARTFILTWLSYASYYLTRKPFAVVKTTLSERLGFSVGVLALIDTVYLTAYAAGQFLNGYLGDRLGPRRLLGIGMLGTAACAYLFGANSTALVLTVLWAANGLFQSSGWPGNVKAMTPWFGLTQRGTVMGVWGTCYQVGGIASTALAGFILVRWGWRTAFFTPATWVAILGAIILLFLVEHPRKVGLESPQENEENATKEVAGGASGGAAVGADGEKAGRPVPQERMPFLEALGLPGILNLGGAYFCLKLIRYTLLFWLPTYLEQALGYPKDTSAYLSTAFEAGGVIGAITIGYLSDRYVAGRRVLFAAPLVFCIGLAMGLYILVGRIGMLPNALAMGLVGFCLFGPDSLLSGAAAQDLGGQRGSGSAAGIINGMGSIGAILQGSMTAYVESHWGWQSLFFVLMGLAFLATGVLAPLVRREFVSLKAERSQG